MKIIPDKSIDMILCDLPYGTTDCKWDVIIPFEPLWEQYKRIIKDKGCVALFGSEPFSSYLRLSNISQYKYDWIWEKDKSGNIGVLKYQPAKVHETISIFHDKNYSPIMDKRPIENKRNNAPRDNIVGIQNNKRFHTEKSRGMDDEKYPISIRKFNVVRNGIHPTQKPVELCQYLIKTYTKENETVLDNCSGSGTTGVACKYINRKCILIEKDDKYFQMGIDRIRNPGKRLKKIETKFSLFEDI
jgi:DNA modification methylase